jgi:hypothetical protein
MEVNMSLTNRELWTLTHGMILGALFLLAFAGGLAGFYSLRPELVTPSGLKERLFRLKVGTWLMAAVAWLTVITGTYVVYPWYRAPAPEGADLSLYPRSFLKASETLSALHTFGMEWKEHIAWFAPILATVVAYLVARYGPELAKNSQLRRIVIVLFVISFTAAGIAGLFGALIAKAAPIL